VSTRGRKADLKAVDGGLAGVPRAPDALPEGMLDEWTAIAAEMVQRKILTTPALGLLETYIIARWTVRACQKSLAEHGPLTKTAHGMLKPNPAAGIMNKATEAVARLAAELGITPAARAKQGFQQKGGQRDQGAPSGLAV
jgi:P27 family predicted phage terminase small subunit